MKKLFIALLFTASIFNYINVNATEHHSAHRGGSKSRSGTSCIRPRLEKFLPPNMATVAPGAKFSFVVFNIDSPDQLEVTAKKLPVEINAEFKDPFYVITGTLPAGLSDTVARLNIKVNAKTASCEAETGWLLKISQ